MMYNLIDKVKHLTLMLSLFSQLKHCLVRIVAFCLCLPHCASLDLWANLGQPSKAFMPLMFEQRKRAQHQPGVAAKIWSVVDLDQVHMHMKVSDLLGNVWAPSVAVHAIASAPAAKWTAEELDGKFCLDRSWIFVDNHFKEPLVQALSSLLTHPIAPAPHHCTCTFLT